MSKSTMAAKIPSKSKHLVKEPKQDRSRASMERLLQASSELLADKGYSDFTLQEVSKRSKVSIGSIYCRFNGKDDLIRHVQERELSAMDDEFAILVNTLRRKKLKLRELVPTLIKEFGEFLKRHADTLRPVMEMANVDPVIAQTGKKHYAHTANDFIQLLLDCEDEIRQKGPERAADICFKVVYASLARHLGLGTVAEIREEGDWNILLEDLSLVALHFLLGDPDQFQE